MHSTSNLEDDYIGSGKRLWLSIRKHGRENHTKEILEFLETREDLKRREKEIVNENFIADPMCMNLKEGGEGGFANENHQKKCSIAGKKRFKEKFQNDEIFRNKITQIMSEKMKDLAKHGNLSHFNKSWVGRKHTEEAKKKISEKNAISQKGEKNSQFGKIWIIKDGKSILIFRTQLEEYLMQNWKKGRKINVDKA
jgi:hypothetical protein